jgi:multiple antibiotic resistance protein
MLELTQLIVLFAVIFDPPASFAVFYAATKDMEKKERQKIANLAIFVAGMLSFVVIIFGEHLLDLFSTNIDEFRIAGGIVLGILGVKMALGYPLHEGDKKENSARAIAAIIGTPLLTGPAAITAMLISIVDSGRLKTALAVCIVLVITAILFFQADRFGKVMGKTSTQVMTTILGLITLAWSVKFITEGIHALF